MPKAVSIKSKKEDILLAYQSLLNNLQQKPISELQPKKLETFSVDIKSNLDEAVQNLHKNLVSLIGQITDELDRAVDLVQKLYVLEREKRLEMKKNEEDVALKRQREEEEFVYNFEKRKKRQGEDLQEARKQEEESIHAKAGDIKTQEKELLELRTEVGDFDTLLETSVKTAVSKNSDELLKKFIAERTLLEQKTKAGEDLLKQKIESLEAIVLVQTGQVKELQESLRQASQQLTRIAERAVEKSPVVHS